MTPCVADTQAPILTLSPTLSPTFAPIPASAISSINLVAIAVAVVGVLLIGVILLDIIEDKKHE